MVSKDIQKFSKENNQLKRYFFRNYGFVVFDNFFTESGITKIENDLIEVLNNKENTDFIKEKGKFEVDNKSIKVLPAIDRISPLLYELNRNKYLLNILEELCDIPITPLFTEYFNKDSKVGSFSPPHQDQIFYNDHFNDELGLAIWFPLFSSANRENGGLSYSLNKDYLNKLYEHTFSKNKFPGFSYELNDYDLDDFIDINIPRGGAVIHHSFVPHFSHSNTSEKNRKALAINFRTSHIKG